MITYLVKFDDDFLEILSCLSRAIRENIQTGKDGIECRKLHDNLATKQDLITLGNCIMAKLDDLVVAATELSVSSDALSVKVDIQNVKIDALLVAFDGVVLPPAAEAALEALKAAKIKTEAAGDKVDAQILKLDAALGTPIIGIPGAPVITTQPSSQQVAVGSLVTLAVVATGENLVYQWKFNGEPIVNANAATLVIQAAALTDAGTYTVTVSNENGSVTSSNHNLTVTA